MAAPPLDRQTLTTAGYDWLLESTFLCQLDAAGQDRLLAELSWTSWPRGALIVKTGDRPDGMALIVEGSAEVFEPGKRNGQDEVWARLAPGHVFGERSLLKQAPAQASVRALSPVKALHLPAAAFATLLAELPAFRSYVDDLVALRDHRGLLTDLLLRHPFLRLLGKDDMQRFLESGRLVRVKAGESIVKAGERTADVYVVVRGRVAVYARTPAPKGKKDDTAPQRERLASKGPGWLFGHAAALLEAPRTADIDALENTELLQVHAPALMAIVARNPALRRQLYQELAESGVRIGQKQLRERPLLISVYGTRAGIGTTSIAYGLAASLLQHTPLEPGSRGHVALVDLGGATTAQQLGLDVEDGTVGGHAVRRLKAPEAWNVDVLWPVHKADTLAVVEAVRAGLAASGFVIVAAVSRSDLDVEVMRSAEAVVFVRSSQDGTHDEAAERHQYRVDAVRLEGGVLPLEATGRAVRFAPDSQTLDRWRRTGDLSMLANKATVFGRASQRLERALLGRTVGLALGGGGALGFAHVGLIRAMHQAEMPIDYVAGVSFGSVVGGLYAAGGLPALERMVSERKTLIPPLLAGFVYPQGFEAAIHRLGGSVQMSATEIPFFPVGVDVNTGREVVRAHGTIGHGVHSSSCLPGAYPALRIGGQRIVDGGIHNNVPASVTWQAGAHFILASNIIPSFPFAPKAEAESVVGRLVQRGLGRFDDLVRSLFLLMSQSGRDRAQLADFVFDLELTGHNVYDFQHGDRIAAAGESQAREVLPDILAAWQHGRTGLGGRPVAT